MADPPKPPLTARHRNFFTAEDVSFAALSEYTDAAASTRARALFAQGRRRLLLYTERAHFYFRYRIRGTKVRCQVLCCQVLRCQMLRCQVLCCLHVACAHACVCVCVDGRM